MYFSQSPGSEVRRLIVIDGRERQTRARRVSATTPPSVSSIAGGDSTGRLSLGAAAIAMVVPVGREAGGEVVTKPGKTDGRTDGWRGGEGEREGVMFSLCGRSTYTCT